MDPRTRDELIEKLTETEVKMEIIRKELPIQLESLERLLNSVDELNALGTDREEITVKLSSVNMTQGNN